MNKSQLKQIIKEEIHKVFSEIKVEKPLLKFNFPFYIYKKDESRIPYIVQNLNTQGYSLKGKEFKITDLNFNFPTILDYDSNYRHEPERKILNTYSPSW